MPKEQIIAVMTDLYLADVPMARVPQNMRDSVGQEILARIARTHGLEPAEIERMVEQVQMSPELNIEISDSVIARLERMQLNLQKEN